MESEISCDICLTEFNENIVLPKVLNCGHSFCLPCIKELLVSSPKCPKCRKQMEEGKAAKDYPTVYLILDAVKLVKRVERRCTSSEEVVEKIKALTEKFTDRKLQITTDLDQMNNYIAQLQGLTNSKMEILDMKKAKQIVESLEKQDKIKFKISEFSKLRRSMDINLTDFEDSTSFLTSIYNRLMNGETIYAVKNMDDLVKYGKLTLQNNGVFFSTFSETTKPDNSSLIWYDELKQCENKENQLTFLKLCCNESGDTCTVVIKMVNPKLNSRFIKLCTGELGPTYKGCNYEKFTDDNSVHYTPVLEVKNYMLDLCYRDKPANSSIEMGEAFVKHESNGGFKIYRALSSIWTSFIGKVVSPRNFYNCISFEDASNLKVVDCGVIFQL